MKMTMRAVKMRFNRPGIDKHELAFKIVSHIDAFKDQLGLFGGGEKLQGWREIAKFANQFIDWSKETKRIWDGKPAKDHVEAFIEGRELPREEFAEGE